MKEILWYIVRLPLKFYIVTWTYFLIWRGKRIPHWLQEEVVEQVKEEIPMGRYEPMRR